MKNIKDELQNIILRDEQIGPGSQLKKIQSFLRGYAETSIVSEKQQYFKNEEAAALVAFAARENLFYNHLILSKNFISEGAEQKVYKFDDAHVLNYSIPK
jgi:hypothetical protein